MATDPPPQNRPSLGSECPNCGAHADPGQLVCLECGARLALDYRRPRGWRPAAAVIAVVLLIAGAARARGGGAAAPRGWAVGWGGGGPPPPPTPDPHQRKERREGVPPSKGGK